MIKINLLPDNFKKKEETRKSAPDSFSKIPIYPIMAAVFLMVLAMHVTLGLVSFNKKMQIDSLEKHTNNMQVQFREVENTKKDIVAKKDKIKIVESLLKKELYLTQFLNEINQATLKGFWLTGLSFSSRGLVIEGSVFSFDSDEVSLVNGFFNDLKSDSLFVDNFIDFNMESVQKRNIKEYEVLDFLLTAKIKKIKDKG